MRALRFTVAILFVVASAGHGYAVSPTESQGDVIRVWLPKVPYAYSKVELPRHARAVAAKFDNTPTDNPVTDHGATLGRVLFYDPGLSVNGTTSCASCHQQKHAFTDPRKLSVGFDGEEVPRNSMSLVNVRYYPGGRMFWDERAESLEAQSLMPIENEVEMGHSLDKLVPQLQRDPTYSGLFVNAFGDSTVTKERVARALSQFVRSIVSFRSKYDIGLDKVGDVHEPFPNFTEQENYGKDQFFGRANCASCHLDGIENPDAKDRDVAQSAFFYLRSPAANGIDGELEGTDAGLATHTKRESDVGRFKVPSLRNVALTAPYMHDGRFALIEQVVEHYNWSVRPHPNLDPRLAEFAANGMALPETEKRALIAFLSTLTDTALINDKRYSDPFKAPSDTTSPE